MKELKNYLILALVSVLIGLALYSVSPVTPPVAPGTPPVVDPLKPQPIVIKTLVDYYADWCGPCKAAKPMVDKLEKEGVIVHRVNADKSPELLRENNINSLPTFFCTMGTKQLRTQDINKVVAFFK
jgi:thiol-disulfide isomerase/thioredoxin